MRSSCGGESHDSTACGDLTTAPRSRRRYGSALERKPETLPKDVVVLAIIRQNALAAVPATRRNQSPLAERDSSLRRGKGADAALRERRQGRRLMVVAHRPVVGVDARRKVESVLRRPALALVTLHQ